MVLNLDQTTGADVIQLTTSYITTIVGGSRKEFNIVHSVELQTVTRYLNRLFMYGKHGLNMLQCDSDWKRK